MDTIKVLFAGDFAPCHKFEPLGIDLGCSLIDNEISKIAQDADISFVNLECPLTKSNSKKNKSGPSIKADPRCIDIIKNFNLVGLANNHVLDYGERGLIETIKVCKDQNKNITGA